MASVYSTGTVAASATSATDMRTALDAVITTHTAWSFVEAVTITGGTSRVYKCAGASNSWGSDFYVALTVFTASPAVLVVQVFESWAVSPTSQATRAIRSSGTASTAAPNSNGGFVVDNTGYPLDTAASNVARLTVTLDTTTPWNWMLHMSKSRIELSTSTASTSGGVVAGVCVPNPRAVSGVASVFPLFGAAFINGQGIAGPGITSSISSVLHSRGFLSGSLAGNASFMASSNVNMAGAIGAGGALTDGVEATVRGAGVVIVGPPVAAAATAAAGFLRGSLPGMYTFFGTSSLPRALDLVVLSDSTRLALIGAAPSPGLALLTNVDADN